LLDVGLLALFATAIIATAASPFGKASLLGLFKYSLFVAVYVAFCYLLRSHVEIKTVAIAALIGMLWVSCEGIVQTVVGAESLATWEDPNTPSTKLLNRIYSTLLNPNLLAGYLLVTWPLLIMFLPNAGRAVRVMLCLCGMVAVYLTLQTGSRAAWLALLAQIGTLSLFLLSYSSSRKLKLIFASLVILGVIFIFSQSL